MLTQHGLCRSAGNTAYLNGFVARKRALRAQRLQITVQSRFAGQQTASEVIVVGAGAAGLTAAYFAASQGAQVPVLLCVCAKYQHSVKRSSTPCISKHLL